jgi:hypothetical protein
MKPRMVVPIRGVLNLFSNLIANIIMYSKKQLLLDIHDLVEKYIQQELSARLGEPDDDEISITVVSDSEGDDIDTATGDIWDVENQKIVGRKNLETKQKEFFDGYVPPRLKEMQSN